MAAVAQLRAGMDALLGCGLSGLAGEELVELLVEFDVQVRRMAAADAAIVAEIDQRGLAGEYGCTSTAALLSMLLRVDAGRAARRVRDGQRFGGRRAVSGEVLAPEFAQAAEALAAGAVSVEHARVVNDTVHSIPIPLRTEKAASVEAFLVERSQLFEPRTVRGLATQLIDTIDPDGTAPREAEQVRRRHLTVRQRPDGSSSGSFELTSLATEALLTVLDPLAAPRPKAGDGGGRGQRDDRTPRAASP